MTPDEFRARFALAAFPDGGIVIDVATGSYSRLNRSAITMCVELEKASSLDTAIEVVSDRLHIPTAMATDHVQALMTALLAEGIRQDPPDPYRYRIAKDGGYDLWHNEKLALHIDERGLSVRLVTPASDLPLRIYDYVSAVAPKILFLQGVTALHASSCLRNGKLLGMSGRSRAGKTTTARTLARYTDGLISEDLLIFADNLSQPRVFVGGEDYVDEWSLEASRELTERADHTVEATSLARSASGETLPLGSIWFLDALRRGDRFETRPLGRTDALGLVLANSFLGAAGADDWRHHLAASQAITLAVDAYEIEVPNGLDRLDLALKSYTTNSAS